MSAIRRCLFVALLALVTQPAFAAPGPVTRLVAPAGEVAMGVPITFSWQAVPESTWYLLWLGKGTPTALVMEQWYSADQAGCASGGGTCSVTLTAPVNAGSHVWFIQTWAAGVVGPWSPGLQFVVTAPHWSNTLPDARRFSLVLSNQGVLDNETGLVWHRQPATTTHTWAVGPAICANIKAGGRKGWRMPTLSELLSVMDPSQLDPALSAGHPFVGIDLYYWTQTVNPAATSSYFTVSAINGTFGTGPGTVSNRIWCVRAASTGGQ